MEDPSTPVNPSSLARQTKNPLSIRLNNIYNTVLHNNEKTKNALTTLSQIPDIDNKDLNKNLRGYLERNALDANQRFLTAFSKLDEVNLRDCRTEITDSEHSKLTVIDLIAPCHAGE
jgi:hypothetical protein